MTMEQVFFNVPLAKLEPVFKGWVRDVLNEIQISKVETTEQNERKYNAEGAADFLGITVPTLYSKISKNELPSCKAPGTKRLFFFESDLINFLKSGRKLCNAEIEKKAKEYLSNNKKGLRYEK